MTSIAAKYSRLEKLGSGTYGVVCVAGGEEWAQRPASA